MPDSVVIAQRYCGPPGSGNGGYVAGALAERVAGRGTVEVTLTAPPPLDRPLRVEASSDTVELYDRDTRIASARPVAYRPAAIPAVPPAEARAATGAFDVDAYRAAHPFPGCFTCGPDRAPGDGLRLFPGRTGRDGVHAWPWDPRPWCDGAGRVDGPVLWAALDCLSGLAWSARDPSLEAFVLGRMTASVDHGHRPDGELVVAGWLDRADGRKRTGGGAVWTAGGRLVAVAALTWVVLDADQRAAFGSAIR